MFPGTRRTLCTLVGCATVLLNCAPQAAWAAKWSVLWTESADFEQNLNTTQQITSRGYIDTTSAPGDVKLGIPRDIATTATMTQTAAANNKLYTTGVDRLSIAVLDPGTNSLLKTIALPTKPSGVAYNSTNNKLYVGSLTDNKLYVINCANDTISATLTLGDIPGNKTYAALYNPTSNKVYVSRPDDQSVSVLDGATDTVLTTIAVSAGAYTAYHDPGVNKVYLTSKLNQYVVVIDGATDQLVKSVEIEPIFGLIGGQPAGSVGLRVDANAKGITAADRTSLSWTYAPLATGQKIQFQIRTAQDVASLDAATYRGPDGTANSWYDISTSGVTTAPTPGDETSLTSSIVLGSPYAPAAEIQVKLSSDGISTPALHSVSLDYQTYPDLSATTVSGPSLGLIGSNISVASTVANLGGEAANNFKVALYLYNAATGSSNLLGERDIAALLPGASDSSTSTVTVPGVPLGTYYFRVCADSANQVVEGNEDNNCALSHDTITIVTPPDLAITAASGPSTTYCSEDDVPVCTTTMTNPLAVGSSYSATATIVNQGGQGAANFKVGVYLTNGTTQYLVGNTTVASLAPGASAPLWLGAAITNIPVGNYTFKVCADDTNLVSESNEDNNCAMGNSITVADKDLVAQPPLLSPFVTQPYSIAVGASLIVMVPTQNIGGVRAPSSYTSAYLYDPRTGNEYYLGNKSMRALDPGQSYTSLSNYVAAPVPNVPPGTYVLKACADYQNRISEVSETNNCTLGESLTVY